MVRAKRTTRPHHHHSHSATLHAPTHYTHPRTTIYHSHIPPPHPPYTLTRTHLTCVLRSLPMGSFLCISGFCETLFCVFVFLGHKHDLLMRVFRVAILSKSWNCLFFWWCGTQSLFVPYKAIRLSGECRRMDVLVFVYQTKTDPKLLQVFDFCGWNLRNRRFENKWIAFCFFHPSHIHVRNTNTRNVSVIFGNFLLQATKSLSLGRSDLPPCKKPENHSQDDPHIQTIIPPCILSHENEQHYRKILFIFHFKWIEATKARKIWDVKSLVILWSNSEEKNSKWLTNNYTAVRHENSR